MDSIERIITLQNLQQKLMYVDFDKLNLKNLDTLRNEVDVEMKKLTGKK